MATRGRGTRGTEPTKTQDSARGGNAPASRGRGRGAQSAPPPPPQPAPVETQPQPTVQPTTQPSVQPAAQPTVLPTALALRPEADSRTAVLNRYKSAGWAVWVAPRGMCCCFIAINGQRCHFIYVTHQTSALQLGNNPQATPSTVENVFIQNAAQNGAQPVLCAVTSRIKRTGETEYTVTTRIAGTNQAAIIGNSTAVKTA